MNTDVATMEPNEYTPHVTDAACLIAASGRAISKDVARASLESNMRAMHAHDRDRVLRFQARENNRLRVYRIDYAGAIHHVISSRMVGVGVHLDHAGMMPESVADAEIEELPDDKELTRIDDITGEPVVKTCRQWIDDEGPGLLMTSEW